jgi:hypothetical protein
VVPIPQGTSSSSSSSSVSSEGAVVRLGESFSRQLCRKDQSFTVHFYEHQAILSFDDTLGQVEDLGLKIWVQVELLGFNGKPLLVEDGKNTTDVQLIPEGAEVALGSSIGCDTSLYLRCKETILSIRFIRKRSRKK